MDDNSNNSGAFFGSGEWDMPMMDTMSDGGEPTNDFLLLDSWQTEQDPVDSSSNSIPEDSDNDDDDDLMIIIDNNMTYGGEFVDPDEIPPTPPAGRLLLEEALEETLAAGAAALQHEDDDDDSFFTTHSGSYSGSEGLMLQHPSSSSCSASAIANLTSFLPIEQRYQATLEKLSESMKKSQETRKSLRIQTSETMEYSRWSSISGTLSSIEKSTQQLQQYLKNKKPAPVL